MSHDIESRFGRLSDSLRDLYVQQDLDGFPRHAIAILRRLIAVDIAAFGQAASQSCLHFTPCDGDVDPAVLAWLERHFDRTDRVLCEEPPSPSLRRQIAVVLDVTPTAAIVLARRHDFTDKERAAIKILRPHLSQAYRNAVVLSRIRHGVDELLDKLEGPNRSVILLTGAGRITHWTERGRQWIQRYCNAVFPRPAYRLPECFDRWYRRELRRAAQPVALPPPEPLIVERGGRQLVVELIPDQTRQLMLLEERCAVTMPDTRQAFGLTAREADVLAWIAKGKTNIEIGTILRLSPRTVQKHLEHIYEKLGVENRTAATVRALPLLGSDAPGLR